VSAAKGSCVWADIGVLSHLVFYDKGNDYVWVKDFNGCTVAVGKGEDKL
jgi:hypothetical protein